MPKSRRVTRSELINFTTKTLDASSEIVSPTAVPNPTVASRPTLSREELEVLISQSWAVLIEDDQAGRFDVLRNFSAPLFNAADGPVSPEIIFGLELRLGVENEDTTSEELYCFRTKELLAAEVDHTGRSLAIEPGITVTFLMPVQLRKRSAE